MKRPTIIIAAAAILVLAVWIAWLVGHSTSGNLSITTPVTATPAAPAIPAASAANPTSIPAPSLPAAAASPTPVIAGAPSQPSLPIPASSATAPANQPATAPRNIDRAAAMEELRKVHVMIASYHTLMGQNPVGTNAEIMKALMGRNPRGAMLGPPPGQSLNAGGELLDPWGTPYFFHQLSGDDMSIISAGPDKTMGTKDDLIIP